MGRHRGRDHPIEGDGQQPGRPIPPAPPNPPPKPEDPK